MTAERVAAIAVPATFVVSVGVLVLEFLVLRFALGHRVDHRGGVTSILSGATSFGLLALGNRLVFAAVLEAAWAHRLATLPNAWWAWLLAFLLFDLLFYVGHRAGHEVRLLWCFHSVHHTTAEMRLTSAIRGSAFDVLYLPWFHAWVPLLGVPPSMLLAVEAMTRIWGVLTHVSPRLVGRLGALEHVLVTPSAHRVHHGSDPEYLDRNYAEVLALWDRLFGTFQREQRPPTYGLVTPLKDDGFLTVQLSPWAALWRDVRRAPTFRARLRYLFDAPGWSHDGPDRRVRAMRAAR
ncbi:MAG: sterol desaturase family protein [Myxococcaceae bacterium]|jgi:sterol desaturase/sphingolipid hydroxylase (fatty acid hydroxylase superfamily)|nr:sterol desaturase family protein [Myxococcaceae bacterium]MCA3012810.1 sterol desaturase family protein [Myxococcaceae bacterium]